MRRIIIIPAAPRGTLREAVARKTEIRCTCGERRCSICRAEMREAADRAHERFMRGAARLREAR